MARLRKPRKKAKLAQVPSTGLVAGTPAVCRAGTFQFTAHESFTNGCVQSRALFWCKSGRGDFIVNGIRHPMELHGLYVLPWNRRITYLPAANDPMYTAHVHLVPWYRTGAVWRANVPHEANEADFNSPDREDRQWEGLTGVTRLRVEADEPLGRLLDYTVRWYRESDRAEAEARALGLLIVNEVDRLRSASTSGQGERPEELTRLLALIERSFRDSPSVKELAVQAGRSRSHVLKLFRKHLGQSAKSYVLERQLREACELLLNTTMRVSEVGRAVGMADPYHFSKLFRRRVGLPPREYRARNGPFSTPPKPSIHQTAVPLAH